jgi:hypothetical protein
MQAAGSIHALHVQRPHQAVLARVRRAPVGVESSAKGVGGYALSGLALVIRVERLWAPVQCPHLSPTWSATSQECPPITSCPSITSTTCTEPEVSARQTRAPAAVLSYLAK